MNGTVTNADYINAYELIRLIPDFNQYLTTQAQKDSFNVFSSNITKYSNLLNFSKNTATNGGDGDTTNNDDRYLQALQIAHLAQLHFFVPSGGVPVPVKNIQSGTKEQNSGFMLDPYWQQTKYGQLLVFLMRRRGLLGITVLEPTHGGDSSFTPGLTNTYSAVL